MGGEAAREDTCEYFSSAGEPVALEAAQWSVSRQEESSFWAAHLSSFVKEKEKKYEVLPLEVKVKENLSEGAKKMLLLVILVFFIR